MAWDLAVCISFLLLPSQSSRSVVALNKTNVLSNSFVGQKSHIGLTRLKSRCWQMYSFLEALGGKSHFLDHVCYWQISNPCGCMTKVPVFFADCQ